VQVPQLLREARRLRGLSIRAAALRCDVPRGTWAGWEAGTSCPTAQRLDEALRVLGLDLRLSARAQEPPGEHLVTRHLRRSLTVRARAALADQLSTVVEACWTATRLLTGPAAVGVWVPHVVARGPLPLPADPGDSALVRLRLDERRRAYAVVPTPAQLIATGAAQSWPALLTSARLLADGPRDVAGRRLPPHRDPDEQREVRDLMHTYTWGATGRFPISDSDSRGWRLGAPATLDEALTRQRLPARNRRDD
jgi:transcriptional regulator with XRE-family HTH domain